MQAGCSRVRGLFERNKVLTPVEVFQKVSPSVFVVEALTEDGKPLMLGSGVALAQDILITNCHVVQNGSSLRVRRGEQNWTARLIEAMPEHDLCGIRPNGLTLQPVQMASASGLATGEHVYAVGSPEGLELTFSEGLISALRDSGGAHVIQTTAPISPGSSGGGLFDTHGKLIGITTFYLNEGQSLNFALPSEWVKAALDGVTAASARKNDVELESTAWLQNGLEALKNEDYNVAVHSLKKSADLRQGDSFRSWAELGKIWNKAWTYWDASRKYNDWLCSEVQCPLGFGDQPAMRKAQDQAIAAFESAIELKPDYAEAWVDLSECHANRKEYDQAISAAKEATRLAPNGWEGWFELGGGLFQTESYDEAIVAFQHAEKVAPDSERAKALMALGMMYDKKGDREHVLKVYQELQHLNSVAAKNFFQAYVLPEPHNVSPSAPVQGEKNMGNARPPRQFKNKK
jgi:tetratricopeptide (TPR) repeat protein